MSDIENENVEPEGSAPETPRPETPSQAPAPSGWGGPSQEEWHAQQEAIARMASYFNEDEPQEEEYDPSDVAQFISREVENRMRSDPVYQVSVNERGEKVLNELHDRFEKEIGKPFDRKLAERAAQSFVTEESDPQRAVLRGVEYAIEVRERERTQAVEEYKASLKRGPHDREPGVSGAGNSTSPPAKTFDEVVDRWAAQTEV